MSRPRLTQLSVELLQGFPEALPAVTKYVVEALQAYTVGAAPSGSFGVATTHMVVEVLVTPDSTARICEYVAEVLFQDGSESGGGGGTVSYGYAT